MKLSLLSLVFTLLATSVFAQWGDNYIKLSENITTENKNITGFDKIDVSEDFIVHIHYSADAERVEIEANENLHDLIKVEQNGRALKIYTDSYSTSYNSRKKHKGAKEVLVANITVQKLTEIKGNEDVIITLEDKIYSDNLVIDLDEDSTLEGTLDVENLIVKLNEDSVLDIKGSAKSMDVKADEDSVINGFGLEVDRLTIELNEDSEAKLTVNGEIDLVAKEDSYFHYKGEANFTRKKVRGDSEVKHF